MNALCARCRSLNSGQADVLSMAPGRWRSQQSGRVWHEILEAERELRSDRLGTPDSGASRRWLREAYRLASEVAVPEASQLECCTSTEYSVRVLHTMQKVHVASRAGRLGLLRGQMAY